MTVINEFTTYCAICGGPVADPDIDQGWLSQTVLLHSDDQFPRVEIQELPARNTGGPYFELAETSEAVTACDKSGSVVPSPKPLYIACHQKCLSLAKRYMSSEEATSNRSVAKSMRHLWLILVNLFERASEEKMRPVCNIYNAQAYGDIWRFQELVWEPSSDPETRFESMHFESDPEDIPNMTESILSHLQLVKRSQSQGQPGEPPEGPPPQVWHQTLSRKELAWLWDLDKNSCAQKEAAKPQGHEWNWELLFDQLTRVDIYKPKAVLEDLPMGLRNRRRIWKIVEDMMHHEADSYYASQWPS